MGQNQFDSPGKVELGCARAVHLPPHYGRFVTADEDKVLRVGGRFAAFLQCFYQFFVIDGHNAGAAVLNATDHELEKIGWGVLCQAQVELGINDLHLPVDLKGQVGQFVGIGAEKKRFTVQPPLGFGVELDPKVL